MFVGGVSTWRRREKGMSFTVLKDHKRRIVEEFRYESGGYLWRRRRDKKKGVRQYSNKKSQRRYL